MISVDQPQNTPQDVLIAYSSKEDGTMLDRLQADMSAVSSHRSRFLEAVGVDTRQMIFQIILYGDEQNYSRIIDVDSSLCGQHIHADALYTEVPYVALFLPTADCVATTIYDPSRRALALLHLGRHSTVAGLMSKTVAYFSSKGSNVRDLRIWMSPSVKKESYVMEYFNQSDAPVWKPYVSIASDGLHLDLQGYIRSRAEAAGVPSSHIFESAIDTATDNNYFSHSQGDVRDRFATVVMMK